MVVKKKNRMRKVGAVIQARVSSTRLPAKVLLTLPYGSGISVCEHVIRRLKQSKCVNLIIVATTCNTDDNKIVEIAAKENVAYFRGDEHDVLARFYGAAAEHNLDEIVRITADNPCIDYTLVDEVVQSHISQGNDYTVTEQYPLGTNVEVVLFKALRIAYEDADKPEEREHVTFYIKTRPESFKVSEKKAPDRCRSSDIRVTLDTEEDYVLLNCVFEFLYEKDNYFGIDKLISLYQQKPWLAIINNRVRQKKILDTLEDELAEAVRLLDLQGLKRAKEFLAGYLR